MTVRYPGGFALRLDLSESLQRDFYAGLYDAHELRLVRRLLRGGDFVDVGAHIGVYTVCAARAGARRVVAFGPNPTARAQLEANIRLNALDNVIVCPAAASAAVSRARLAVPATNDPSFSTLERAGFEEGAAVEVATTTVDDEVERHALAPALVKIDVQDHEVAVIAGMERTLASRPAVLCEVGPETADRVHAVLRALGYELWVVEPRRLRRVADAEPAGYRNVLALSR